MILNSFCRLPLHAATAVLLAAVLVSSTAGGPRGGALLAQAAGAPGPAARPAGQSSPERGAEPVEILPRRDRKAGAEPIEEGEVHLLALLQSLADAAGAPVVLGAGKGAAEEKVVLTSSLERPDRQSITRALNRAGYTVSEEAYHGRKVLWISRELRPSGRRGAILRPGEEPASTRRSESREELPVGDGKLRLFVSGQGPGTTYLVLLETASRAEADDAYKLLLAVREKKGKQGQR